MWTEVAQITNPPKAAKPLNNKGTTMTGKTEGVNAKLRVLDLFSGVGGMTLGLERAGHETVAFCEIDPYAQAILRKNWPGVPIHDDITTLEFSEPVDLVAAGFPCQDISSAGLRSGLAGERSGLFWHILRAVRMVGQPRLLLENVAALLGRGMGTILGALAEIGYDAEWHCIPASAVGAPHPRDRVWIVADPQRDEQPRQEPCVGPFGRMGRVEQSLAWDGGWEEALASFRGVDDGLPRSVHRTDCLRNAVVPQIPEIIGKIMNDTGYNLEPNVSDAGHSLYGTPTRVSG